jgi:adenylate cyclase
MSSKYNVLGRFMADREVQRRLAAILAADVAGYTRLMEQDTDGTVAAWQDAREDVIKPQVSSHSGKIVKLTGDGFLVEFPTVQDAVNCAISMQESLASSSLDFRMGINLGDIVDDGEDIHGEGVNVAARIEALADAGGISISGMVYESIRNRISANYEDRGAHEVKNVSAAVRVYAIQKFIEINSNINTETAVTSDKPSIAVLPFDNLSGDPEQEYFSDGITEDIITALSHIRQFFVIARNTTFTFKGQSVDVKAIASELGVRYVLEGSVRRAGDRIRITAQLIDGESGNHIWAEKYDRDMEDIFAVQDEITTMVVGAIEPELNRAEWDRALQKPPENLDAWDLLNRGWSQHYKWDTSSGEEALRNFERAVEMAPNFARAHTAVAFARVQNRFIRDRAAAFGELEIARESVETALVLDGQDAFAHGVHGLILLWMRKHSLATTEILKALELNPNLAAAHHWLGFTYVFNGQPEEAFEKQEIATRLSPNDPLLWGFMNLKAIAKFHMKEFEEAAEWSSKASLHPNCAPISQLVLVACLARLGRWDECKDALEALSTKMPDVTVKQFIGLYPFTNTADELPWIESLRDAGLPEE